MQSATLLDSNAETGLRNIVDIAVHAQLQFGDRNICENVDWVEVMQIGGWVIQRIRSSNLRCLTLLWTYF